MKLTPQIHKDFKLNKRAFKDVEALIDYSASFDIELSGFLKVWFNSEGFIKQKTSGATGLPKLIKLKKEHMVNSALATGNFFKLGPGTKALHCLPNQFIAGKMMLVRALTLGWHLKSIKASSRPLLNLNEQFDFCAMIPWQVSNSIDQLDQIKTLIVGGADVPKELVKKIQNSKSQVYATYGMTETCSHIALKHLNNTQSNPAYVCLPKIKISIDQRSCLVIEAKKVSDNIIITNDLVEILDDKRFIWLGRYDNIINSGAVKLIPEVIEQKLSAVIFKRFFIAGIQDDKLGQKLILVIESASKDPQIFKKIKALQSLGHYEIPKEVFYLNEFAETRTKKIQRAKTLDLLF